MQVEHHKYESTKALLLTIGVLMLCICTVVFLYWTRHADLLNFLFPFLGIVLGGLLYATRPVLYVGFTMWIWFLTPFIRRVVDYQIGEFTTVSFIMLTPYLVSGFALFSMVRFGKLLMRKFYFPILLAFAGVMYGYLIGIANVGVFRASFALIEWLVPIPLGFHVLAHWQKYPSYRSVIRMTFVTGVLFMGVYGTLQYLLPSAWDKFWMINAGMNSIGHPEAFRLRVFSTLNAPGPFAMTMMAGLLLLFEGRGLLSRLAILPGYVSFLLSMVRGAWGGWIVGLVFLISRFSGKDKVKLVRLLVAGVVILLPLQFYQPASQGVGKVEERLGTLGDIQNDGSFRARVAMYNTRTVDILTDPIGKGFGYIGSASRLETGATRNVDSGILAMFISLGWPGTLLYLSGVVTFLVRILRRRQLHNDQFVVIITGCVVAFMVLMLFSNQVLSLKGIIVWIFLALAVGSERYYQHHQAPVYHPPPQEPVPEVVVQ